MKSKKVSLLILLSIVLGAGMLYATAALIVLAALITYKRSI
jgi:hypothetical protein